MKSKRGFTLVEMLVVLAIIGIITVILFQLVKAPIDANTAASREFQVQGDLKETLELVNVRMREAGAATIANLAYPESSLKDSPPEGYLKENWDYLVYEKAGGQSRIVYYRYNPKKKTHTQQVLSDNKDKDMEYYLLFSAPSENRLRYKLVAKSISPGKTPKIIMTDIIPKNANKVTAQTSNNGLKEELIKEKQEEVERSEIEEKIKAGSFDSYVNSTSVNAVGFRTGAMNVKFGDLTTTPIVGFTLDMSVSMEEAMDGTYFNGGYNKKINLNNGNLYMNGFSIPNNSSKWAKNDYLNRLPYGDYYIWGVDENKWARGEMELLPGTRMEQMRIPLKQFFNTLKEVTKQDLNTYVSLNTFASSSIKKDIAFRKLTNNKNMNTFEDELNNFVPIPCSYDYEHLVSGTNVGDGLRRTYFAMDDFAKSDEVRKLGDAVTYSLVLMTDGEPSASTSYTSTTDGREYYYITDGRLFEAGGPDNEHENPAIQIPHTKNPGASSPVPMQYVKEVGEKLIKKSEANFGHKIHVYVIGFSSDPDDKTKCNEIGEALGAKKLDNGKYYYDCSSGAELDLALTEILHKVIDPTSVWKADSPF